MSRPHTRLGVTALALTTALSLSACSGLSRSEETAATQPTTAASAASSTTGSSAGPVVTEGEGGAAAVGLDATHLPKPMGTMTIPGDKEEGVASVKVDLLKVERRDKLLYLVFGWTPTFTDTAGSEPINLYESLGATSPEPVVVDGANLKLYKPVQYDTVVQRMMGDALDTKAAKGQTAFYWALTPYPNGASTVDVMFSDTAPAFVGVQVPR